MNFSDALRELIAQLCDVIVHDRCYVEFSILIKKDLSGHQADFLRQMSIQLRNLQNFKHGIYKIDDNEKLKGTNESLYSLHMQSKNYNVRLIVSINKEGIPLLLTVFNERSGKKATDYTSRIPVAESRLKELKEAQK